MRPRILLFLFSALSTLSHCTVSQAQVALAMSGEPSQLLDVSALPPPDNSSISTLIAEDWTQRRTGDYVGAELGVVGLVRQKPNSQVLATDKFNQVLLNADELQGDMQFGVVAKVDLYQVANAFGGTDLQLGYWGINSLDATRTVTSPDEVRTSFFGGTTSDPIFAYNYNYSSNLYSGEANFRLYHAQRLRPLIGIRYLKLEDTFNQVEFTSSGTAGFFSLTNNSLFGAQLGLEATLLRYRSWDWFAVGKYGAMHNSVECSALAAPGGVDTTRNFDGSSYCSLVDGQTGLIFRFVDALHFRAAYQALYCSDIATGVDQSGSIDFFSSSNQIFFDSRFWQGVSLSATVSF